MVFYFVTAVLVVAGCQNCTLQSCTKILASVHEQVNCCQLPRLLLGTVLHLGVGEEQEWKLNQIMTVGNPRGG